MRSSADPSLILYKETAEDMVWGQRLKPLRAGWLHFLTFNLISLNSISFFSAAVQTETDLAAGVVEEFFIFSNSFSLIFGRILHLFMFFFFSCCSFLTALKHSPPPNTPSSLTLPTSLHSPDTLQLLSFYF